MKDFEKNFISIFNDYVDDYSAEELLDELFPGQTIGEILWDVYNLGGIPTDTLEAFLEVDAETHED